LQDISGMESFFANFAGGEDRNVMTAAKRFWAHGFLRQALYMKAALLTGPCDAYVCRLRVGCKLTKHDDQLGVVCRGED
jgi:predicted ATPase